MPYNDVAHKVRTQTLKDISKKSHSSFRGCDELRCLE